MGDITPTYCMLKEDTLKRAKQKLQERGFCVKAFFNMREPAERLWSHVKMLNKIRGLGLNQQEEIRYFEDFLSTSTAKRRSDFKRSLEMMDNVFDKDELFIGFYESFFEASEIQRFSEHINLEIPYGENIKTKSWSTRDNSSYNSDGNLTASLAKAREAFKPIRDYVRQRFPMQTPPNWH